MFSAASSSPPPVSTFYFLRHQHSGPYIHLGCCCYYCSTSIFCALYRALTRQSQFCVLCPSYSGHHPLSSNCLPVLTKIYNYYQNLKHNFTIEILTETLQMI